MERIWRQRRLIIATMCVIVVSTLFGVLVGLYIGRNTRDRETFVPPRDVVATPVHTPREMPPLFRIVDAAA
jgi:hypothetical protein